MRVPPNAHPVTSIRTALTTVAALLGLWLLLGLAACSAPTTADLTAPIGTTGDTAPEIRRFTRPAVTLFAPVGPIPLTGPRTPLRDWSRARA